MTDAQLEVGGYFSFEQPARSLLLLTDSVQKLLKYDGVRMIMFDMCMFGLRLPEDISTGNDIRVLKPTVIVTNIPGLERLARWCDKKHQHRKLIGSVQHEGHWIKRSALAAVYPHALCRQAAARVVSALCLRA
jgi:hypothetical protein